MKYLPILALFFIVSTAQAQWSFDKDSYEILTVNKTDKTTYDETPIPERITVAVNCYDKNIRAAIIFKETANTKDYCFANIRRDEKNIWASTSDKYNEVLLNIDEKNCILYYLINDYGYKINLSRAEIKVLSKLIEKGSKV